MKTSTVSSLSDLYFSVPCKQERMRARDFDDRPANMASIKGTMPLAKVQCLLQRYNAFCKGKKLFAKEQCLLQSKKCEAFCEYFYKVRLCYF